MTSRKERSITSLIDIEDEDLNRGDWKWCDTIPGVDDSFYGIPCYANYVHWFNPTGNLTKTIGPDLGNSSYKWSQGVMADSGVIYCIPYNYDKVMKIDTNVRENNNNGNVTIIDAKLPEEGNAKWMSGATSKIGGCIYCMPHNAKKILKINPKDDSF